jgi:hypothetical protein
MISGVSTKSRSILFLGSRASRPHRCEGGGTPAVAKIADGDPRAVAKDRAVVEAYLGEEETA